jgi:hypothetical protein
MEKMTRIVLAIILLPIASVGFSQSPWQLAMEIGWSFPFANHIKHVDDRSGYGLGVHLDRYVTRDKRLSLGGYLAFHTIESEFNIPDDLKLFHNRNQSFGGRLSESASNTKRNNMVLTLGGSYAFVHKKKLHIEFISKIGVSRVSNSQYSVNYRFLQPVNADLAMYEVNPLKKHRVNFHLIWMNGVRLIMHSKESVRIFSSLQHAFIPNFSVTYTERELNSFQYSNATEFVNQLERSNVNKIQQTNNYHFVSLNFGLIMNIFNK